MMSDDDRDLANFEPLSQSASLVSKDSYSNPPTKVQRKPTDDDEDDDENQSLGVTSRKFCSIGRSYTR